MHVFVPIYKQKLYILKIELFLGIHMISWNKKSALKCFKCYSKKRLHNFVNRLEIGTTIIQNIFLHSFYNKRTFLNFWRNGPKTLENQEMSFIFLSNMFAC